MVKLKPEERVEILRLLRPGSFPYWLCSELCRAEGVQVFADRYPGSGAALLCADDDTILVLGKECDAVFSKDARLYLKNEGKPKHNRPYRLFLEGVDAESLDIELEPVSRGKTGILSKLYELYDYDFTIYEGCDVLETGSYRDASLDAFLEDDGVFRYFIRVEGKLAGFVFVGRKARFTRVANIYNIDDFFVMQKYRRHGVGKAVAKTVFDMYNGQWEVLQMPDNLRARSFWRSVISEYTSGEFAECGSRDGEWVGFQFNNDKGRDSGV